MNIIIEVYELVFNDNTKEKMLKEICKYSSDEKLKKIEINKEKKAGVWFLIGKSKNWDNSRKDNSIEKGICLQVAQAEDIFYEINRDIKYLQGSSCQKSKNNLTEKTIKKYINQFGEYQFTYKESDKYCRLKQLYQHIGENFDNFKFVCVMCKELEDSILRRDLEKYIAYKTKSKYWVNGRPYKEPIELQEEQARISNMCFEFVKNKEKSCKYSVVKGYLDTIMDNNCSS